MVDKIIGNVKAIEITRKINEIIDNLKISTTNPVGNLVSYPDNSKTIQEGNYVLCDFSHYDEEDYPIIYNNFLNKNQYTKMYGLRRHIAGEGCLLYTTNPDILKEGTADVTKLFRKDYNGLFVNVKEDISMSFGTVMSSSGFYNGTYTLNNNDSFYIDKNKAFAQAKIQDDENYAPCVFAEDTNIDYVSDKKWLPFSTSATVVGEMADASIIKSDNNWLTFITDGKLLNLTATNPAGTVSKPAIIASETNEAAPMDISFDFITPATFIKNSAILYATYVFLLNIMDTNGSLYFYMARYSGGNYRHANVNTGLKLQPNTKYRIGLYCKDSFMNGTTKNYRWNLSIFKYNDDGVTYDDIVVKDNTSENYNTYEFVSAYCPYDYALKTGVNELYQAAAYQWSKGFLDLASIKIGDENSKYYYTYTANKVTTTVIEDRDTYDKKLGDDVHLVAEKGLYMPYIKPKNSSNTYIIAK